MSALQLSLVAVLSTSAGGLCALRLRDRLHWVLGFTAGMLLGVVAFNLLPETFELSRRLETDGRAAMIALTAGFLLFHATEKFVLMHDVQEAHYAAHSHPGVGVMSAAALTLHSVLDGVGIGLAFQVSDAVGLSVAIAVIAHDFCDGLNTVGLMLMHRNTTARALGMLALDAAAPLAGVLLATMFATGMPPELLEPCLGFFAGSLLYIGAADILPQAHSQARPGDALGLIVLTVLGAAFIFGIRQVSG